MDKAGGDRCEWTGIVREAKDKIKRAVQAKKILCYQCNMNY
jgi:hypothetical protein